MHTEVDVLNTNLLLLPGLYAEATVTLERKPNAVFVPLQALSQQNGTASVDVVDAAGKLEIRKVVTGIQTATDAEIVSGLAEGETVVVSDRSSLKAGETVRTKLTELIQYQAPGEAK